MVLVEREGSSAGRFFAEITAKFPFSASGEGFVRHHVDVQVEMLLPQPTRPVAVKQPARRG
jgi:hypothetical protein